MSHISNIALHETERRQAGRYVERHGLVTSYDPNTYLAKVTFMPEGQESGWLPIETGHIGDGFGIVIGLTPGDGKTTGDQVIIRYQEGDIESGKIVQRVHSDQEKPPKVEAGEIAIWARFTKTAKDQSGLGDDTQDPGTGGQVGEEGGQQGSGQQIYFKKDGSLTFSDGAGSTIVLDGKGNYTVTCQNHTSNVQQTKAETIGKDHTVSITGNKNVTINGQRQDKVSSVWDATAAFGMWPWVVAKSDLAD